MENPHPHHLRKEAILIQSKQSEDCWDSLFLYKQFFYNDKVKFKEGFSLFFASQPFHSLVRSVYVSVL